MQGKGWVGWTGPRMDQIGMPNAPDWDAVILASCLQAGPAGDPPCYRSPWQPGTAILLAHLRILMESPALVHQGYQGLSTKANVTLGSLPTQQRLAERGCSCPLSILPSSEWLLHHLLLVQWDSPGRQHHWKDRSAIIQIHQDWPSVLRLKKPLVTKFKWQISSLFSVLLVQSVKLASAPQLPIHDT